MHTRPFLTPPHRDDHAHVPDDHGHPSADREAEPATWPATAFELLRSTPPCGHEADDRARLGDRIVALLAAFRTAPEYGDLGGRPPRYIRPFLEMMADLAWDVTRLCEVSFRADVALALAPDLPVWARTADLAEAHRMQGELRSFFAFAERTSCLADAPMWRRFFDDDALTELLRHTMRTDPRLRSVRPPRGRQPENPPQRKRTRRSSPNRRRAPVKPPPPATDD